MAIHHGGEGTDGESDRRRKKGKGRKKIPVHSETLKPDPSLGRSEEAGGGGGCLMDRKSVIVRVVISPGSVSLSCHGHGHLPAPS